MEPLDQIAPAVVTIALSGEYDLARADELRDAFLVPLRGAQLLQADMAGVTFMDSTGLRTLVLTHNLMAERGVLFQVVNVTPTVLRVFEITGTAQMFGI
jgi:anti-sigma B factor antagonist